MRDQTRLPSWASALVAGAEAATNTRDLDAIMGMYAPNAEMEVVAAAKRELYAGSEALVAAWAMMLREADAVGLEITKELLMTSESVITAGWHGRTGVGVSTRGVEVFWTTAGRIWKHLLVYGTFADRQAGLPA
jgi:hypothetical protein